MITNLALILQNIQANIALLFAGAGTPSGVIVAWSGLAAGRAPVALIPG